MIFSMSRSGKRVRSSALNSSISRAAIFLNSGVSASPEFELLAVDQERARTVPPPAVLDIAEQGQLAVDQDRSAALLALIAGDVVIDQLRGAGVVADHDEDRFTADAVCFPFVEDSDVVAI